MIIFGKQIDEGIYQFLLEKAKQFRDSLMHPSPFSALEKFGGYDKLEKLFNLDIKIVSKSVSEIIEIIKQIELKKGDNSPIPIWLPEVKAAAYNLLQRSAITRAR
jgi:hypothetical protein